MKIKFTKLPTTDGTIKISLDGGQSFTDYSIANIPEDGISLRDDQDFEKIRIKGPANLLKNLDIVSGVKVEIDSDVDLSEYIQKEYFCGEVYDGGCGCGYRITSYPKDFSNYSFLDKLCLEDGTTLGRLCEYDGHFDAFYDYDAPTFNGQLYAIVSYQDGCPGATTTVPTQYFLKTTVTTSNYGM